MTKLPNICVILGRHTALIVWLLCSLTNLHVYAQSCPTDPDCAATFAAYKPDPTTCAPGADYNCAPLYHGQHGKLRIPLMVRRVGSLNSSTPTQFYTILASANQFLADSPTGIAVEFYVDAYGYENSSNYDDALGPVTEAFLQGLQTANPNRFIVFIGSGISADTLNAPHDILGDASYPYRLQGATIEESRTLFLQDSVVANNAFIILAHELGHMLGLLHTFDNTAFPAGSSCASVCRINDGIDDTSPYAPAGQPDNFMEYEEGFVGVPHSPNATLSPCQSAKMLRVLYEGRNTLGLSLSTPTITDASGTTLTGSFPSTFYNDPLDTLAFALTGAHKSFTEDFAHVLIRNYSGDTLYQQWRDSLDLNTLYGTIFSSPGTYTIEVRDKRHYGSAESTPRILTLPLLACNLNGVCDPWETATSCPDCYVPITPARLSFLEYFIDTDPGRGNGTIIPLGNVVAADTTINIPLNTVSPGIHTLYVRAKDDQGRWSFTQRRVFLVQQGGAGPRQLTRLEYFIDTDPGRGNATPLPLAGATASDSTYNIDLSSVGPGIHTLYVRAKDDAGTWSFTQRRVIIVTPGAAGPGGRKLDYLEYFIDTDPGRGNGTSLALQDSISSDSTYTLDLTNISPGIHTLYVRARDNAGVWSFVQRRLMMVTPAGSNNRELAYLEYFIDSDPGRGSGTSLPLTGLTASDSTYNIDLTNVAPGIHTLYVRARDNANAWSFTQRRVFMVTPGNNTPAEVEYIEYWTSDDPTPARGQGTPVPFTPSPAPEADETFNVSIPSSNNNYTVYVRARDTKGRWSFVVQDTLYWSGNEIEVTSPSNNPNWIAGQSNITFVNWDTTNNVGNVEIHLVTASGNEVLTIDSNEDPEGPWSGSVAIPIYVNAGNYRIRVRDRNRHGIVGYSNIFTISSPAANWCLEYTDLDSTYGGQQNVLAAANCLCSQGYITPQNYGPTNTYGVQPNEDIFRADLAKLVWSALNGSNAPSVAELFPSPFADLQQSNNSYYRFAKALAYLEYNDDVAPFDRDFINFRPYEYLQTRYAFKAILEAFDIGPLTGGSGTVYGLQPGEDGYGYMRRAQSMGLIASSVGDAFTDIKRGEVFHALYELLDVCNGSEQIKTLSLTDYFIPGNFTPYNLSRNVGVSDGYFRSHTQSSFAIPGRGLSLNFGHTYNSYLTELPREYRLLEPLGRGWSHTYDTYILLEEGWSFDNLSKADEFVVALPGGSFHVFDAATFAPQTQGSRYKLRRTSSSTLVLRSPDQIDYTYTEFVLPQGYKVYILDLITDRNGNELDVVQESITWQAPGFDLPAPWPRLKEVVDDHGRKLTFSYGTGVETLRLTGVADVAGGRSISYTPFGKTLHSYTNALGDQTQYAYGSSGSRERRFSLLTEITLPEGNIITNTYDAERKLAQVSLPGQNVPSAAVVVTPNYTDPSQDYQTSVTSPSGPSNSLVTTSNTYNANGYLSDSERNGKTRSFLYGASNYPNQPTRSTYEGRSVNYSYDGQGRVTTISLPESITHRFQYNSRNDVTRYTDPRNQVTSFTYDANGNLDKVIDPMGGIARTQYNAHGQPTRVMNPNLIATDYTYHPTGPLATVTDPIQQRYTQNIDNIGRINEAFDGNGSRTTYTHDALDRITNVTREGIQHNITLDYGFDGNGNVTSITNALGGVTTMTYDNRDLLSSIDFGGDTRTYTYQDNGQVDDETSPNNDVFDFQYDAQDRLIDDGYATYAYDNFNRVVTKTKGSDVLTYSYDNADRVTSINFNGESVTYGYDANGNTTSVAHAGFTTTYTYDNLNRLTRVRWTGGTGSTGVTYGYFADGRMDEVTNPNGTKREYGYDQAGRLTSLLEYVPAGSDTIAFFTYQYDGNDNIGVETKDGLAFASPPVYAAADLGYAYNGENELTSIADAGGGSTSFAFDANGRQTDAGGDVAIWDARDRLESFRGVSYGYDPAQMRRSRTAGGVTTEYVLDARGMGHVLAEKQNGVVTHRYVHGAGLTLRIDVANGGVEHFYHYDYRGSTVAMTDDTAGITHRYQYLPFGEQVQSSEAFDQPFTYVGRYGVMDEGSDLYFMRARYYDANTGRFMSEDPVWHDNLYPYADNNPVKMVDPNGDIAISGVLMITPIAQNSMCSILDAAEWFGTSASGGSEARKSELLTRLRRRNDELMKDVAMTLTFDGKGLLIDKALEKSPRSVQFIGGVGNGVFDAYFEDGKLTQSEYEKIVLTQTLSAGIGGLLDGSDIQRYLDEFSRITGTVNGVYDYEAIIEAAAGMFSGAILNGISDPCE